MEPDYPALKERYETDPLFHALVYTMSQGEDGVPGPTLADARRVQKFFDAVESLNYIIVPDVRKLREKQ